MKFFIEGMNPLEKVCLVFVALVLGSICILAVGAAFLVCWKIHPMLAIVTFAFIFSATYLSRDLEPPR